MIKGYDPIARFPDNSKAGLSIRLNQKEGDEPFEATVYFSKSGKSREELQEEGSINLTAVGKLRLDIGDKAYIEIFAEKTGQLKEKEPGESQTNQQEGTDENI